MTLLILTLQLLTPIGSSRLWPAAAPADVAVGCCDLHLDVIVEDKLC